MTEEERYFAQLRTDATARLGSIYQNIAKLPRMTEAMKERYGDIVFEVYDEYAAAWSQWRTLTKMALGAHYDHFSQDPQWAGLEETREEFIASETASFEKLAKEVGVPQQTSALFEENKRLVLQRPLLQGPNSMSQFRG